MSDLRHLLRELHRRSLWQVLLIYLTASWVVYQVALDLAEGLGLPEWVPPTVLILLMVGLPVVLATAFIQEGVPDGGRSDSSAETPVGAAPPDALAPADGGLAQRFTWRNAAIGGIGAFALLGIALAVFAGGRLLGIGPGATLLGKGALGEDPRIVLADFESQEEDLAVAEMITEALRVDLEQSPVVELASPRTVRGALERMMARGEEVRLTGPIALEVARREGVGAVLVGELHRAGAAFVISARLLGPGTEEALASFRSSARDSSEIIAAVDELSSDIRARIGESLASIRRSPPLERVTTASLAALESYTTAMRLLLAEPESPRAIALLEEAIRADTAFAMAMLQLAWVDYWGDEVRDEAGRELIARAHRHRDRLSPRERLFAEAEYQRQVLRDPRGEREALDRLLSEFPDDRDGLIRSVWAHEANGEVTAAREDLRTLLTVDSTSALAVELIAVVAAAEGDYDAAERAVDRYETLAPSDSMYPLVLRADLAAARGDLDAAEALYSRLRDTGRGTVYEARAIDWGLSQLARMRGNLGRYITLEREAARLTGVPETERRLDSLIVPVRVRAWFGAPFQEDLAALRRGLADGLVDALDGASPTLLDLSATLALAGDAAGARRYLDRWLAEADSIDLTAETLSVWNARGEIAMAEGRGDDALEAFLAARIWPCASCRQVDIGRAHELAGRADAARAAYTAFLDGKGMNRIFLESNQLAIALQRLASLDEAAGNTERARLLYARFLELWEDADPDLQPQVDAARRSLQRLVDRAG